MARRLVLLLACLLALSACRLDVTVDVAMQPDGTGEVTMVAVADADLIAQVPDLVADLRLDDAMANGWVVGEPTPTDAGGLSLTLSHPFASSTELANVLASVGPPLAQVAAARTQADDLTTNAINGELVLNDGFGAFADADLVQAVGGVPFGAELDASGLTPAEAMSFTFRVSLPGELIESTTGTEVGDGVIEWTAPLDGSSVNLYTATVQRPAGSANGWAGPLSSVAFITLVAWLVVAATFIGFVAIARRRKARRRNQALRHLERR